MTECPTCGGPCTKTIESTTFYGKAKDAINRYHYESLVKGKVIAEGWAKETTVGWNFFDGWHAPDSEPAVLVIQKEEPMTGGQA